MAGVVRYGAPNDMASFIDSADPVYGTGADGSVTLDGTTTILGMIPSSNVYSMTSDLPYPAFSAVIKCSICSERNCG